GVGLRRRGGGLAGGPLARGLRGGGGLLGRLLGHGLLPRGARAPGGGGGLGLRGGGHAVPSSGGQSERCLAVHGRSVVGEAQGATGAGASGRTRTRGALTHGAHEPTKYN